MPPLLLDHLPIPPCRRARSRPRSRRAPPSSPPLPRCLERCSAWAGRPSPMAPSRPPPPARPPSAGRGPAWARASCSPTRSGCGSRCPTAAERRRATGSGSSLTNAAAMTHACPAQDCQLAPPTSLRCTALLRLQGGAASQLTLLVKTWSSAAGMSRQREVTKTAKRAGSRASGEQAAGGIRWIDKWIRKLGL